MEMAKRGLRNAEMELAEAGSYIYELMISIEYVNADRQRLESDITTLNLIWKTHNGGDARLRSASIVYGWRSIV